MTYIFGKIVVVALGGSIIFPDKIDWKFLKKFRSFIKPFLKSRKFIIVAGGGRLARLYQEAAAKVAFLTDDDKDWLGIHATRSNAYLLRTVFRKQADPILIDERHKIKRLRYPITIASGWRPGWSTDYIAVVLAKDFGAGEVIIAGKPAYVYDKDPYPKNNRRVNAKPLYELTWSHYRKMIPAKWMPGAHAPVDPVAARLAEKQNIKAIIINGRNLNNFGKLLNGGNFEGTIIQ